jgi:hypothetical protein
MVFFLKIILLLLLLIFLNSKFELNAPLVGRARIFILFIYFSKDVYGVGGGVMSSVVKWYANQVSQH